MSESTWHQPTAVAPLRGNERFAGIEGSVVDFWRFAMPDLRMNNVRGYFAEYLVSRALGVEQLRVEWDDYDVLWKGVKIEVKSSGYLQAWAQQGPSAIVFSGLRRKAQGENWALADEATYKADVYVFAWHTTQEPDKYDALDVDAWAFHVLAREQLEQLNVGSLTLSRLEAIGTRTVYSGLADAVAAAAAFESAVPLGLPLPARWDRGALEEVGFEGFARFSELKTSSAPSVPGIYIVLRESELVPEITESTTSTAHAPFSLELLRASWVDGASVVYIGKAENIRSRLLQYARRGSNHGGGRSIWQLADQDELIVAWVPTPGESAGAVEIRYRAAFTREHGRWPFANRKN
ncbi:GIY-YIG domain-containing protein [Microbacterium galbinum]|uniref:GIY-YIG domain-containing protein n=1 Tax=Microbacterium galbinum TaxID=2851646 RepID=A0ABY4IWB5_9MICO|nr:hypothetical protein [Microbacterium galbinum]UPL15688.1 hypothetical protein KV396_14900 [Microbacterium galbinum]